MSTTEVIIIILTLGIVAGGVLVLKKSAKKLDLTAAQLKKIKQRNQALDDQKKQED